MNHIRIFRHYINIHFIILGLLDFALLLISAYVGYLVRFQEVPDLNGGGWASFLPSALFFALIMLMSMIAMGVYQARFKEGLVGAALRTSVSLFLLGGIVISATLYLVEELNLFFGRGVLAIAAISGLLLTMSLRLVYYRVAGQESFLRRVLVLGAGYQAKRLFDATESAGGDASFVIAKVLAVPGSEGQVEDNVVTELGAPLVEYVVQNNIDEIVVALDERRRSESGQSAYPVDDLLDCKQMGKQVVDTLTFIEREAGKIEPRSLSVSWMLFSDGFTHSTTRDYIQRGFDILASSLLLLVSWPFMLFTVIAIKLEEGMKAPIFYSQARVGYAGKVFMVHKFRSMRVDAEKFGAQWAQENDPRITKIGNFIRNTRIDELPQIFNVFKGEMSFVGPRPERPEFVEQLKDKIPYFDERHRAKPGITGWAQLLYPYGASDEDSEQKLKYDLYYVKNRSILLDLVILIRTVEVILVGNGVR